MQTENWISLMDYSNKYQVSLSTLRRRIKGDQLGYQIKGGKYFLNDQPLTIQNEPIAQAEQTKDTQNSNEYLTELKKAYAQVLFEKEEHIQTLREEIADLKTLVSVLETENLRLSKNNEG